MGEKPKYGGVHFLGTGSYTALNQAAADELYSQLPKATPAEWEEIQAAGAKDEGGKRKKRQGK